MWLISHFEIKIKFNQIIMTPFRICLKSDFPTPAFPLHSLDLKSHYLVWKDVD